MYKIPDDKKLKTIREKYSKNNFIILSEWARILKEKR